MGTLNSLPKKIVHKSPIMRKPVFMFFLSKLPWLLCREAVNFGYRNAMAANNNCADQSVRMCRLILTFIVCIKSGLYALSVIILQATHGNIRCATL